MDADQQRLHTAEQRVSPARDQQFVATSVEVDQERLCVAKKQVLAASSTREASVASGQGADEWREASVVDWFSDVSDIL